MTTLPTQSLACFWHYLLVVLSICFQSTDCCGGHAVGFVLGFENIYVSLGPKETALGRWYQFMYGGSQKYAPRL